MLLPDEVVRGREKIDFTRHIAGAGRAGELTPARVAVAAAFVALLVHTLLYAAFLEDPLTWALLALGTGLAAAAATGPSPADAEP